MATFDSLLPQEELASSAFSHGEERLFEELARDAELDAIIDALFPDDGR